MALTAILARATNGTIGRDGTLPWHIPADLKRFKALTMGKPMIMGRRTFESLGKPLPGRRHIVLTRDPQWRADGVETAHTPERALALAGTGAGADASVIGGAEIYRLLMPFCARIELTEVHADIAGDTAIPPFGPAWREIMREDYPAAEGRPAFSFVTLERAL